MGLDVPDPGVVEVGVDHVTERPPLELLVAVPQVFDGGTSTCTHRSDILSLAKFM